MIRFSKLRIRKINATLDDLPNCSCTPAGDANVRCGVRQLEHIDPDFLYVIVSGLHGDQADEEGQPKGNDNGDFFEWSQNHFGDDQKLFVLNGSKVNEKEYFGYTGELMHRRADGTHTYETWRSKPNLVNHAEDDRVGEIIDVYPIPNEKSIDKLLKVSRQAHNGLLAKDIESGKVTDVSMGTFVKHSICSVCKSIAMDEDEWCDHLKFHKGKKIESKNVYEINKGVVGLECSWITIGVGADSKAKQKLVLAEKSKEENEMPLKSITRSSGTSSGGFVPNKNAILNVVKSTGKGEEKASKNIEALAVLKDASISDSEKLKKLAQVFEQPSKEQEGETIEKEIEKIESEVKLHSDMEETEMKEGKLSTVSNQLEQKLAALDGEILKLKNEEAKIKDKKNASRADRKLSKNIKDLEIERNKIAKQLDKIQTKTEAQSDLMPEEDVAEPEGTADEIPEEITTEEPTEIVEEEEASPLTDLKEDVMNLIEQKEDELAAEEEKEVADLKQQVVTEVEQAVERITTEAAKRLAELKRKKRAQEEVSPVEKAVEPEKVEEKEPVEEKKDQVADAIETATDATPEQATEVAEAVEDLVEEKVEEQLDITAKFVKDGNSRTASKWVVAKGREPLFSVSLAQAFEEDELKEAWNFEGAEYGKALAEEVKKRGPEEVIMKEFGGRQNVTVLQGLKRKAQVEQLPETPTVPGATTGEPPAMAPEEVTEEVLEKTPEGSSFLKIIKYVAAPLVASEDTAFELDDIVSELQSAFSDPEAVNQFKGELQSLVESLKEKQATPEQAKAVEQFAKKALFEEFQGKSSGVNESEVWNIFSAGDVSYATDLQKEYRKVKASLQEGTSELESAKVRLGKAEKTIERLLEERSKRFKARRAIELVEKKIQAGLLETAEDLISKKVESEEAKKQAKAIRDNEIAELMDLDDKGFAKVSKEVEEVIKRGSKRTAVKLGTLSNTVLSHVDENDHDLSTSTKLTSGIWSTPKVEEK